LAGTQEQQKIDCTHQGLVKIDEEQQKIGPIFIQIGRNPGTTKNLLAGKMS